MEERVINGKKVYFYPAKPRREVSEVVKYYLCAMIPKGRLVTYDSLIGFLAKKLNTDYVEFKPELFDQIKYIDYVLKYNRTYRIISSKGRVDSTYMEKLGEEDFLFEPATKYMVKRKDYKKYLFNFETESDIDKKMIERIDKIGYTSLKKLDSICN